MVFEWKHHLPIGDLIAHDEGPTDPEEVSAMTRALAARLRSLPQYATDRVLRYWTGELAEAVTLPEGDEAWRTIALWGDQDHVRVLFCTGSAGGSKPGRPRCEKCADWFILHPAWHPAFTHPDLAVAVDVWCEVTGTDPDGVRQDPRFTAVAMTLITAGLLGFRNHDSVDTHAGEADRAALVMLAGAWLARTRDSDVTVATRQVARLVADHLGTPTGYEGEPDRLARLIHAGTLTEAL